jgi:ABC-type multidrug transport system ATPase subunit
MMRCMLALRNVTHTYPDGTRALDAVDLTIRTGMFGLLGPNGAGKSTLMRCIATLQTPAHGSIHFGDIDVRKEPEKLRPLLGYLPQDFGVYPRVSAYELLNHLAILKGLSDRVERKQSVEALLQQVNLWPARKRAVASFSGGMRQRFGIAQALLGNPRLIIVDEPTAGLDPEERNRFNDLLAAIGEHVVVILSTHIVEDVTDLCSSMAILLRGRVVEQGDPQELVRALQGRVWRRVVERGQLDALRTELNVISTRLRGGRSEVHVASDAAPGADFAPAVATLEHLYFATLHAHRAPLSAAE